MSSKVKTFSMKSLAQLADDDLDNYASEVGNQLDQITHEIVDKNKPNELSPVTDKVTEARPITPLKEITPDPRMYQGSIKDVNPPELVPHKSPKHQVRSEVVDHDPLNRSSSNSSSSSMELDTDVQIPGQFRYKKQTKVQDKARRSSVSGLRDSMSRMDETDGSASSGYYGSASAMWSNRGKIFSNLKKQASDGVRSLTQSTSLDTGFNQGIVSGESEINKTPPKPPPPRPPPPNITKFSDRTTKFSDVPTKPSDGLIKVETESLEEGKSDDEVSSFLHGFKEKLTDPLQALANKKKEEDELRKELEEMNFETSVKRATRHRSFTSSSVPASDLDRPCKVEFYRQSGSPSLQRKAPVDASGYKSSLVVSLSSLLGRTQAAEADISPLERELQDVDVLTANAEDDRKLLGSEAENNNNNAAKRPETPEPDEPTICVEPPSMIIMLAVVCVVYFYLVFPVPTTVVTIVRSFLVGSILTTALLCIVAPTSQRTKPFLPVFINRGQPYSLPKTLYDPDQPIRGWMNETFFYDPTYYHVSNTQAAFITLDGSNLRIQTPQKGIAKRSTYKEGNIPISNVVHQRLFDITFAKIYLKPDGLVKKRVWSKKYPVVVEIPKPVQTKSQMDSTTQDNDAGEPQEKVDVNKSDIEILYLFGRTDRQKEEWFYRIQRSINVALARHIAKEATPDGKQSEERKPLLSIDDGWGVIDDNHYKEETFLSSSLCLGESINSDPLRAYKDYYLHISRLMPDDFPALNNNRRFSKDTRSSVTENAEAGFQEPGLEVAWINVLLGRITFDFLRQPAWAKWLSVKIQKKLDKIKLPYFMDELKLTELNLGGTVPLVHQISLPKLDAQGLWLEMEVTYSGSAHMTLKTKLVLTKLGKNESAVKEDKHGFNKMSAITDSDAEDSAESSDDDDESTVSRIVGQVQTAVSAVSKFETPNLMKGKLGDPAPTSPQLAHSGAPAQSKKWVRIVDSIAKSKYFQRATETEFIRKKLETVSNTPMMLSVELLELRGVLAVNIPPPPTDRIWYGFRDPPNMVVKAHPQVGERLVKTSHVTDWIEHKLQQEFMKVLVMPNMDDIPIPVMFHNRPPSS